jgi:hypothetical protein
MVRDVTSPDGMSWRIEIEWIARRIRNPFRRSWDVAKQRFAETRRRRRERKEAKEREDDSGSWLDCVDCPGVDGLDDLAVIALAILAIVLIFVLIVWVAPVLWAVLAVLIEFFFVTLAAIAILVWRTVLRRPWRIVALGDGQRWWTDVVGYRAARRRVREVATGIERGSHPEREGLVLAPMTRSGPRPGPDGGGDAGENDGGAA